ncbi:AraC family transcriptional regulator [Rhodoplanes sp. TEM]|uniref:AraC family transcriptional regulator n=1 Tax=Rhodoplanes tepidamans TaxID=200616 RepID=A0ABT5J4B2_RHOTP|nr:MULTISPECIES: AraC family transcriptional regulator [Rhodoplanes]MDC7784486.1 AraC family transcriptional regulator [Rhodoplanes tepidamans]MDC7983516.1 AraC family transcriptional regulator [Rhodoplanes sp. TEM]MDQ0356994.1 AraC-like DNA-binding protein [Rhodoplanes tepidamans]
MKTIRLVTSALPARDRIDRARALFGALIDVEFDPLSRGLEADFVLRALPGLAMTEGWMSPVRATHRAQPGSGRDLLLVLVQSGAASMEHLGRRAVIGAGEAVLTTKGELGVFVSKAPVRVLNLRLDRARMADRVPGLDDRLMRTIPAGAPALRLLADYVRLWAGHDAGSDPAVAGMVADHLHDIVAVLLAADHGPSMVSPAVDGRPAARAARRRAVQAEILHRAGEQGLTLDKVARRLGISASYARKLLDEAGTTFTDALMNERLRRAHRLLTDPGQAGRPIGDIALAAGFGDLSYFNRSFRRRYGGTPTEIRAAAVPSSLSGSLPDRDDPP